MLYKLIIAVISFCVLLYTVSYGIYEWKSKNTLAGAGVFFLCFVTAVLSAGVIIIKSF